ncbi:MAG: exo-alpha-sialidase [Phycisphaerae bacterium]|nr:exo-alpha-sialidase [Phycisphaerae bacterium]
MRQTVLMLCAGLPATTSLLAASPQKVDLLKDRAERMVQTSGSWRIADGVLRPTDVMHVDDYSGDVGGAFFPAWMARDFTLTCEFMIPKGSTGAGGPSVYFHCAAPDDYHVVHFINYWNTTVLMRARPGEFETELAHHQGAPIEIDKWHRLEIRCDGEHIRVALDDMPLIEARDAPKSGIIGLGARVREVRYRNARLEGPVSTSQANPDGLPPMNHWSVVCQDSGIGGYEAFPGLVRLANDDLLAVFYSGWTHVSRPGDLRHPKGGRICLVRSADQGKTWTKPQVVGDTPFDDRDPFVWQGKNGTVHCAWPACDWSAYSAKKYDAWCHAFRARSTDNGRTWSEPQEWRVGETLDWTVWTAPRLLSDGSWLMPVYKNCTYTSAAVIRSLDDGKTWSRPLLLDEANRHTDEPDIVELPGRRLLCIMRPAGKPHAWESWSDDLGKTWTKPKSLGWHAHSPNLLLTSKGVLLCAHRDPGTAVHYSLDCGKTWSGMVMIDSCGGAYPGMVELPDGRVLVVYYTEGERSDIRGQFLEVTKKGVRPATP